MERNKPTTVGVFSAREREVKAKAEYAISERWRWHHALITTASLAGIALMLALSCGCAVAVEVVPIQGPQEPSRAANAPADPEPPAASPEMLQALSEFYGAGTNSLQWLGAYLAGDADQSALSLAYLSMADMVTALGARIVESGGEVASTTGGGDQTEDGTEAVPADPTQRPTTAAPVQPTPENPDSLAVILRANAALEGLD